MLKRISTLIKKEAVLFISAICAIATMFFVPPDSGYIEYIDLRVLCLLFSLMAVVAGFQACGIFRFLTIWLLKKCKNGRLLGLILILLPFFSSMLITNDVALIVFVPFTIGLLTQMQCKKAVIPTLVLQTVAANLGSIATPVGNPQNLFLYSAYNLTANEFFAVTLPLTAVSLLCLSVTALPILPRKLPEVHLENESINNPKKLILYFLLFAICLLTVFRIISFVIMTITVVVAFLIADRKILAKADYALLATFVCFFIVSGNLGRIEAVNVFLAGLLQKSTLLTAAGAGQIISNVPAAVLLSSFTNDWRPLLQGVNIGGLGTPIASLASLITLKLYLRSSKPNAGKFLLFFLATNISGLVILLGFTRFM